MLNAALALYISNRVDSIKKGVDLAKDLIDSGKALKQCQLMKGIKLTILDEIVQYKNSY